jgi:tetratricopeptide (TPR) repeat protein
LNKQKFNYLLKNSHEISAVDREGLHELVKEYPYCQILHTLVAKANLDAKTPIAQNTLSYAAMYATDRQVLKAFIQGTSTKQKPVNVSPTIKEEAIKIGESDKKIGNAGVQINQQQQVKITIEDVKITEFSDDLRDEVWADLKALKASKANYMAWLEKSPDTPKKIAKVKVVRSFKNKDAEVVKKAAATKKAVAASIKKKVKPKTTAKATKASPNINKPKADTAKKTTIKKKPEVKSAIKKAPLKEQIRIIDKFIDEKPSISSRPVTKVIGDQEDLSIASTKFGEDLISENLAVILIEQGKTDKAIDIYKKLIWKFPQKKAYFAAQIEALTK